MLGRGRGWFLVASLLAISCTNDAVMADGSSGDDGSTGATTEVSTSTPPSTTEMSTGVDSTGAEAECGNGIVEGDEACDDANGDDFDECYANCQAPYTLVWQEAASAGAGLDELVDVVLDDAGNIYAAGAVSSAAGDVDLRLVQYTPDGNVGWSYTHAGAGGLDDFATGVVIADGDLVVSGAADDDAIGIVARVAIADGSEVWINETTIPDFVGSIATDGTDVVIAGVDQTVMGSTRYVAKLDPAGAVVWENIGGGGGAELTTDAAGNLHLLVPGGYQRLDPDGAETMTAELTYQARALTIGSDGQIAIAGGFNTFECKGVCGEVHVYDPDFAEVWDARFDMFGGFEAFNDVRFTADGEVVVVGEVADANDGTFDLFAARFTTDGQVRWSYRFGADAGLDDRAYGLALDPSDGFVVVGVETTGRTDGEATDSAAWIGAFTQGTPP